MKVHEVIARLAGMPQDESVYFCIDDEDVDLDLNFSLDNPVVYTQMDPTGIEKVFFCLKPILEY